MPKNKAFRVQLNKITPEHLYFGSFARALRLWNRQLPKGWRTPGKGSAAEDVIWVQRLTAGAVSDTDGARASRLLSGAETPKEFWFENEAPIWDNLRQLLIADNGTCEQTDELLRFLGYIIYHDTDISRREKEDLAMLFGRCFPPREDAELLNSRLTFLLQTFRIARRKTAEQLKRYRQSTKRLTLEQAEDIASSFSLYQEILQPALAGKFHILSNNIEPIGGFLGRERELVKIAEAFQAVDTVFLTGISGIGKSELARKYAAGSLSRGAYDHVVYGMYDGSLAEMVERSVRISDTDGSWRDKLDKLARICEQTDKKNRILLVIDNLNLRREELSGQEAECWAEIRRLRCKRLLTSTEVWPEFRVLSVERLGLDAEMALFRENAAPVVIEGASGEIRRLLDFVEGHTLAAELLAKTLKMEFFRAGFADKASSNGALSRASSYAENLCHDLLRRLHQEGLGQLGTRKVKMYKDETVQSGAAAELIAGLFNLSNLTDEQKSVLSSCALFPLEGVPVALFRQLFSLCDDETLLELTERGWLRFRAERISIHPLIAQTILKENNEARAAQESLLRPLYLKLKEFLARDLAENELQALIRIAANTVKYDICCSDGPLFILALQDHLIERQRFDYYLPDLDLYCLEIGNRLPGMHSPENLAMLGFDEALLYTGTAPWFPSRVDYWRRYEAEALHALFADVLFYHYRWPDPAAAAEHLQKFLEIYQELEPGSFPLQTADIERLEGIINTRASAKQREQAIAQDELQKDARHLAAQLKGAPKVTDSDSYSEAPSTTPLPREKRDAWQTAIFCERRGDLAATIHYYQLFAEGMISEPTEGRVIDKPVTSGPTDEQALPKVWEAYDKLTTLQHQCSDPDEVKNLLDLYGYLKAALPPVTPDEMDYRYFYLFEAVRRLCAYYREAASTAAKQSDTEIQRFWNEFRRFR